MRKGKALLQIALQALLFVTATSYAYGIEETNNKIEKKRVVLESNIINGVNILTQEMMPLGKGNNTIYVINNQYEIKECVIIPDNCVLLFSGGIIDGKGSLIGRNTYIAGDLFNIIGKDVSFQGKWNLPSISPDWFIGSDIEKIQKAIDVSLDNGSAQINIDRTYNLTGGTIYVDRGLHFKDEISQWSRRSLIISGSGEGRLIKEDKGFMFSAKSTSIDFDFENLHFRGYISNPSNLNTIVDMYVFDCSYLGNVRVSNCSFCHCGCVYYQTGGVSTPMQGVLSINNQYMKNKCVLRANECWHPQFISDAIDDGISFIECEGVGSSIRDLKVGNCCIEGFYHKNTSAINLNCTAPGLSITDNYFEANYCSIKIPRYVSGIISGNTFHSRGAFIKKDIELHCIELAGLSDIEITANNVVIDDNKMCLFYFDSKSPYYSRSQTLYGKNKVAGKTILSNIEGKVQDIGNVISQLERSYIHDVTSYMKRVYPQIKGGKIVISTYRGMTTISLSNLEITKPISSGSYSGNSKEAKPYNPSLAINGALVDRDKNLMGIVYVTSDGDIGLRMNQPGTYSGVITYPHQ